MSAPAFGHEGAIGFVVKTYPKLSETFILGEILGLEELGLKLKLFSLQRATDALVHAQVRSVRASVDYLDLAGARAAGSVARAHLGMLCREPAGYLRAAARARRRTEPNRLRSFLQAGALAHRMARAGIRHLHAHFASEPATVAELACTMTGGRFSISAHAKDIYLADKETLAAKLRRAAFTVTCTEYNRRHLAALCGPSARVHRMYHGIDLARFDPGEGASGLAVQADAAALPPLVLSVGRLREKKGFRTLIDACALLMAKGREFRCEIIGYGPDESALRAQIARYGLGQRVHLLGKLRQDQVIEAYRRAAMFVLPCQIGADGDRDGIPNVLLEAMAMGLPVVSTDVSGIPEVLHPGANGLLIPPADAGALALAMDRLLSDPAEGRRMGVAGRRMVDTSFNNLRNLRLVRDLLTGPVDSVRAEPSTTPLQECTDER